MLKMFKKKRVRDYLNDDDFLKEYQKAKQDENPEKSDVEDSLKDFKIKNESQDEPIKEAFSEKEGIVQEASFLEDKTISKDEEEIVAPENLPKDFELEEKEREDATGDETIILANEQDSDDEELILIKKEEEFTPPSELLISELEIIPDNQLTRIVDDSSDGILSDSELPTIEDLILEKDKSLPVSSEDLIIISDDKIIDENIEDEQELEQKTEVSQEDEQEPLKYKKKQEVFSNVRISSVVEDEDLAEIKVLRDDILQESREVPDDLSLDQEEFNQEFENLIKRENLTSFEDSQDEQIFDDQEEGFEKGFEKEFEKEFSEELEEELKKEDLAAEVKEEPVKEEDNIPTKGEEKKGFFSKLKDSLFKTKNSILSKLNGIISSNATIDDDTLEDLEEALYTSDLGVKTTEKVIENIRERVKLEKDNSISRLKEFVTEELEKLIKTNDNLVKADFKEKPFVVLVVGVNGNGKTTTIGKLAKYYKDKGLSVLVGAADTFRAAAIEQLETWANRAEVDIVKQEMHSDPAAVAYNSYQTAIARNNDVLLIDTAGRLHNKANLMKELEKIGRVIKKLNPNAPHEVLLVLDATTGQNALSQAKQFNSSTPITGIVLSKLDGTAKGGVAISINQELDIPVKFIGIGEKIADLQEFDPKKYVKAIFE